MEALKKDLIEVMTTSQEWWPADWGHYTRSGSHRAARAWLEKQLRQRQGSRYHHQRHRVSMDTHAYQVGQQLFGAFVQI